MQDNVKHGYEAKTHIAKVGWQCLEVVNVVCQGLTNQRGALDILTNQRQALPEVRISRGTSDGCPDVCDASHPTDGDQVTWCGRTRSL